MKEPIVSTQSGVVDPTEYVTDAWLAFVRDPNHNVGPLRDQIEAMLDRLLFPRTLGGFFDGVFDRIVKEAASLTLSRFLAHNRMLLSATQSSNRAEVSNQLMRSIWLSLQAALWRIRTHIHRSTTPSCQSETYDQLLKAVARIDNRMRK
jgi:hypothetical protein